MRARRLLVLCYFYPPLAGGGVHRVLGFTRHLPEHGWRCTVVCAGAEDYWVLDESLLERIHPETEVIRVPGGSALSAWLHFRRADPGRRSGGAFSLLRALSDWWFVPDSYVGWAGRAVRAALRRAGEGVGFDAMLSSSPPESAHVAAAAIRRRLAIPWVADFRDPWFPLAYRRPPTAWHRARQVALERRTLEGADLVIAASATHAGQLEGRIAAGECKIRSVLHLPNGFESEVAAGSTGASPAPGAPPRSEDWPATGIPSAPGVPDSTRHAGPFHMVFTGTLSLQPDALVFMDALHQLLARHPEARRRVRVSLIGPYDTDYADRALALGLAGIVEFKGPLSHREARDHQRSADLLLLWKTRGLPTMVPGKLYEYLDAGRALLAIVDEREEVARLVARAGGTIVPPGDPGRLEAELERDYLAWKSGTARVGRRPDWLSEHTREALTARLAVELDRLAGSGAAVAR